MIRIFSNDLRAFINTRADGGGIDAEMAYTILCRMPMGEEETPNYFGVVPKKDDPSKVLITYTTRKNIERYGLDGVGHEAIFAEGKHRLSRRPGAMAQELSSCEDGNILDTFVTALNVWFGASGNPVEVFTGKDIGVLYNHRKSCTCGGIGDLASSCMRYDYDQSKRFMLYEKHASMAGVLCSACGGLRGRAILWHAKEGKFIDRRYGSQSTKETILLWGKSNEYTDVWRGLDHRYTNPITISVPGLILKEAPYLDTVAFWCRTCEILSNIQCQKKGHDVTHLRGVHGTNHVGWWGRCPTCHAHFRDENRRCPNLNTCPGCKAEWCGPSGCPNQCITCDSCRAVYRKDGVCPNACLRCEACGAGNRKEGLLQTHGRCRKCYHVMMTVEVRRVVVKRRGKTDAYVAHCPQCNWRVSFERFHPVKELVPCSSVHRGDGHAEGGHCISCNTHLVWEDGSREAQAQVEVVEEEE